MDKPKLKVTVSKKAQKGFRQYNGEPCSIKYMLTDVNDERYEAEVQLKNGWNGEAFMEAVTATMLLCDAIPKEVEVQHIIKISNYQA